MLGGGGGGNAGSIAGNNDKNKESRSTMEALYNAGLQPYAMDFRGFGGTPHDATGYVEPMVCVSDLETVLEWMSHRHGAAAAAASTTTDTADTTDAGDSSSSSSSSSSNTNPPVHLLGWSQGALVAHLAAQKLATSSSFAADDDVVRLDKLILYGSIYDPLIRYPREPLYTLNSQPNTTRIVNTYDMAIEDFTLEGTIAPEPAKLFAEAALISDPIKAVWKHSYQFNNCDPARIIQSTMVIGGDQDPYAPLRVQQDLFCNLGRGSAGHDRVWAILADCDHAVHLLNEGRHRFIQHVVHFIQTTDKRGEK